MSADITSEASLILGVGSPMLDILVPVDDCFITANLQDKGGSCLLGPDELDRLYALTMQPGAVVPGGSAANTIFGLSHLGMPTALLGKLGDDDAGRCYLENYAGMGGDCSRFKFNRKVATGRCLSLITPDSERTMRTDLGAAMTLSPEELTAADFAACRHVHVEGYLLFNEALTRRVLVLARENACSVSLDLASFEVVAAAQSILPELLAEYVDIVFANEDEAQAFTGKSPEDSLPVLAELCEVAAVKLGPEGALIQRGREQLRVVAERTLAVDTTGAGDLWASGFLAAYFAGASLDACGKAGSITGAAVVRVLGAAIPNEAWPELRKRCEALYR